MAGFFSLFFQGEEVGAGAGRVVEDTGDRTKMREYRIVHCLSEMVQRRPYLQIK